MKRELRFRIKSKGSSSFVATSALRCSTSKDFGKSKQLIDAVAAQIVTGDLAGAVIVCPNGLKTNWAQEIAKFSDLPVAVFGAGRKARRSSFAKLRAAFYVINYEAVSAELASLKALLRFKPMALVLDESHRIKTPEAKVTEAVLQLRASARRRYILWGSRLSPTRLTICGANSISSTMEKRSAPRSPNLEAGIVLREAATPRFRISGSALAECRNGGSRTPPSRCRRRRSAGPVLR